MDATVIKTFVEESFPGVERVEDDGNHFFKFGTVDMAPFASLFTNSKFDAYSDLDRPGVFRLNVGISKDTYRSMFPTEKLPSELGTDFTAIDEIMPHPEYGRVYWICVLNPSRATFDVLKPMLFEAHQIAVKKFEAVERSGLGSAK